MKILLFDACTALSSNIGRFHEIFEFLTELKAKNIDEALDIGIYEFSVLAIKLKKTLLGSEICDFCRGFSKIAPWYRLIGQNKKNG